MKLIRILAQYFVLLLCVAACGVMVLCLGVGAFGNRIWAWWNKAFDALMEAAP